MQEPDPAGMQSRAIVRVRGARADTVADAIAVEAPLEIRLVAAGEERPLSITMRTPGDDAALAVGFLHAEGIIRGAGDVATIAPCPAREDVLRVTLVPGRTVAHAALARNFAATSSCGVCGSASLDAVRARLAGGGSATPGAAFRARGGAARLRVAAAVLRELPARLRAAQRTFAATGGLHAVGEFDAAGRLRDLREDVGRHNALDKLIGAALLRGRTDFSDAVLVLSGRAGFEMVQKAAVAGVPMVAAIGAPSSLAIELARRSGLTLLGFLREAGFNVYAGAQRIAGVREMMPAADAAATEVVDEP